MLVAELATPNVQTCARTESVARAARIMWDNDCGCVPVLDEQGIVVGMITDRDICMAAYMQRKPLTEITVDSAASHGVVTVRGTDAVDSAEAVMRKHRIRRVPVVDARGKPTGILAMSDLVRCSTSAMDAHDGLADASIVETLAAICAQPE